MTRNSSPRSSRRNTAPPLAPLVAMLLLGLGGIGAAGYYHGIKRDHQDARVAQQERRDAADAAAAAAPDPFASVRAELAPGAAEPEDEASFAPDPFANVAGSSTSRRTSGSETPLEASADVAWERSLKLGRKADALAAEARRAKARNDHGDFQTKGKAAKEAYDEAFTTSIELELAWIEAFGEKDPRVRRMISVRNAWQDAKSIFHRTTGR